MIKVEKITNIIEKFAPLELAEEWDNSGWQINLGKKDAKNILICLSLTPRILKQAIDEKCDFIICHHPLIFQEFKKINNETVTQKMIIECIKKGIQVYSAHTNLDSTKGGVGDVLCEKFGLVPVATINNYVKIAELPQKMPLDSFILKLKISLNTQKIKLINPDSIQEVKKIALCGGSGGEFVNDLKGVDAFITGDIKYHTALDVQNMVLIDAGHFATERIILETLKNLLIKDAPDLIIAKETEPWIVV